MRIWIDGTNKQVVAPRGHEVIQISGFFRLSSFIQLFSTLNLLKELQEWSQDRMEELAALHAAQQLEALGAEEISFTMFHDGSSWNIWDHLSLSGALAAGLGAHGAAQLFLRRDLASVGSHGIWGKEFDTRNSAQEWKLTIERWKIVRQRSLTLKGKLKIEIMESRNLWQGFCFVSCSHC